MRLIPVVSLAALSCLGFTAAGVTAGPATSLTETAAGEVFVARQAGGQARFVRSSVDLAPQATTASPHAKAMAFLAAHGAVLGVDDVSALAAIDSRIDAFGHITLSYRQVVDDVPVFGARINANFAPDRSLRAVNGDFAGGLTLDTRPLVTAQEARLNALHHVARKHPVTGLAAGTPELFVYRLPVRDNTSGPAVLAWQVEVGNSVDLREFVFVSARHGKVVDSYSGIHDALDRRVYDGGLSPSFEVWSEGDPTPFGVPAIDDLINYTEDAYYFFANLTDGNFLSWNGNDGTMFAVNNAPGILCPNANWNGVSINFCNGTTSDDVVTHEWGHGYTESTHGLIYRWQSGALNESYSDIFGETIDLLNGAGTDAPGAPRAIGACTVFGGSPPPALEVLTPAGIAGSYSAAGAAFNPASADVTGSLVLAADGVGDGSDACEPLINDVAGAVVLIDRGNCPFVTKVLNAQTAGATAVVIANNAGDDIFNMGGSGAGIAIPSVMVGQSDGQTLRGAGPTTVRLTIGGINETTYRWLMGEDATSFGGAIRDMWTPQCFGDPGKVSDGQYFCNGDVDGGGVHSNSGVPNHAFALLADGGTYNGVTIAAIGLDKAAHVYWRAATHYQTPTSDFADHADALEAACADLSGLTLPALSTAALPTQSTLTIGPADCAAVAAAIAAVELRQEPVQCDFEPLLDPDAPAPCAEGTVVQPVFTADFETGLGDWTPGTRDILNPATFSGPDWSVESDLPYDRAGSAAYGPNLVLGNCSNDIEAGIVYLESPAIALPGGIATPRIAFDHSVMTEADYDGANLKISVNGGAWQLVPATAFLFNPYNGALVASDNPMGGEAAFHGSDGGSLESVWGQSQISLAGLASPGDTIRLRFEVGMDGCNGLSGWFVDDVQVYSCETGVIDSDGDSVPDEIDNCTGVANADQRDTDGDGYGNICDADLDGDNFVNFNDLQIVAAAFFASPASGNWNADADLNGDDRVNFLDLTVVQSQFFGPPGPSGLAP